MGSIDDKLHEGLDLHKAGKLEEAAQAYRQILAEDPTHADALNLLGVIFQAAGNWDMACQLGKLATDHHGSFYALWVNYGNALQGAGQLEDAIGAFNRALELQPSDPAAANNSASALNALGRFDEALAACDTAQKNIDDHADILVNRGNALTGLGRLEEARAVYQRALDVTPDHALGLFNMGRLLVDMGDNGGAIPYLQTAMEADPQNAQACYSLGLAYQNLNATERAEELYGQALEIDPDYVDAINNRAAALQSLDRTAEALPLFNKALMHESESADLHWNRSLALLKTGQYQEGFQEYEWRWRTPTFLAFARNWAQPLWQGEDLAGKSLLVHAEQGFGDQIMFARFIPMLLEKGATLYLECRKELVPLFASSFPTVQVLALGDELPETDLQCPMMSLPARLGVTLENLPSGAPYLFIGDDVTCPEAIKDAPGLTVGLCWSGSPTRPDNAERSIKPALLQPVMAKTGLTAVNLQVGPASPDFSAIAPDGIDCTDQITDFAVTAAIINAVDLVVAVDTGVLHLAGALGKEALGVMALPTGFFWMEGRTDSPWYPGLTLLRQDRPGVWDSPLAALSETLAARLADAT